MYKTIILTALMGCATILGAQNYKTIDNKAGELKDKITAEEQKNIDSLKVTGTLNADDITLLNSMCKQGKLTDIDLSESELVAVKDTAQLVSFDDANGYYFGNWFQLHSDDLSLTLSVGEKNEYGGLQDGYSVYLPINMPKLQNYNAKNPPIVEGRYIIQKTPRRSDVRIPYTIERGMILDFDGEPIDVGTLITRAVDGKSETLHVDAGYLDVRYESQSDGVIEYNISFRFDTQEGPKFKGSYKGQINLENRCDNDKSTAVPKRPWSKIDADKTMDLKAKVAKAYSLKNYLYPELQSIMMIFMSDDQKGDLFSTELFVPLGVDGVIPEGEYKVSMKNEAYNMLPGRRTFDEKMPYSWYADISKTDEFGFPTIIAPITEGTMTVSKSGDNYTFKFNFKDDNNHAITGTWTGPVAFENPGN